MTNMMKRTPNRRQRRFGPTPWLLAAAGGLIVAAAAMRRLRRLVPVAPELRSPVLLAPLPVNGLTRSVLRKVSTAPMTCPAGVRASSRNLSRGAGKAATRLLVFEREGSSGRRPVLFWMHGGGYVIGRPEEDVAFVKRLLDRFDVVVASVAYRLAPDHPFPAPLDDCHFALSWVAA